MSMVMEKARALTESKGWEILKLRDFDKNPLNDYLKFVLIQREENDYATLLFNVDSNGFSEGHYNFTTYEKAYEDLLNRG